MSFLLGTLLHSLQESAFKIMLAFRGMLYKCLLFTLTSTVVVWLSVFLYGTFYYSYMPAVSHVKPVHFQFRSCHYHDGPCSFPSANITLIKKGHDQLLMRGQQYKVYLELDMPESPQNQKVGMFMVKIDFYARKGEVVYSSSRSAMLHYKSSLLNTLSTVLFSPLMLLGSLEEKQLLKIELFDYYEEDPRKPSIGAYLEILNQNVQIYSASLHIYAHFTGLRYLMFHWPLLSALTGIGTILFFLTIIALLSWYRYAITHENTQVVVRVGFDDEPKRIEQRRKQAREFILRERQRQTSIRDGGTDGKKRERSLSPAPKHRQLERTQSMEVLPVVRIQELTYQPSQLAKSESKDTATDDDGEEKAKLRRGSMKSSSESELAAAVTKESLSVSFESPKTTEQVPKDDGDTTVRQRKAKVSK